MGAVFAVLSILLAVLDHSVDHLLRAYLLGYMICFGFAGGGLAVLMLQYLSGGKWGLLLRRPLEAMTRTLWLVLLYFIPIHLCEASVSVGRDLQPGAGFERWRDQRGAGDDAIAKRAMLNSDLWVSTIVSSQSGAFTCGC